MKFVTRSASTYEVDTEKKLIRRMPRETDSLKTGGDGVWHPYVEINTPVIGQHVWIKGGYYDGLLTTRVVLIDESN